MRRIAFTGGRTYNNEKTVKRVLDFLQVDVVLVGDASGLDALVRKHAENNNLIRTVYKANWETHGKSAGPIRNAIMVGESDILVAFPGGKGTENCVKQAKEHGKIVLRVEE